MQIFRSSIPSDAESTIRSRAVSRPCLVLGLLVWLSAVGCGMAFMLKYEFKAGAQSSHPGQWPKGAPIVLDSTKANLVVFAHPRCPCTHATLVELEQIVMHCNGRLKVHVLFFQPSDQSPTWSHTPLWRTAAAIPGVEVQPDPDGAAAKLFGAETSGQALLFDPAGKRLFSGGITGARGHEGENAGQNNVVALVLGERRESPNTSVFGCSLVDATSQGVSKP